MQYELIDVPIEIIDLSWVHLRHEKPETATFNQLVESIRKNGIHQSLLMRRIMVNKNPVLSLIDGNRRLSAAKVVGLKTVPAKVLAECDDITAMCMQLECNDAAESVTYSERKKHLFEIVSMCPSSLSVAELALMLHVPLAQLEKYLDIAVLCKPVLAQVERGEIPVTYAVMLTKLNVEDQQYWAEKIGKIDLKDFRDLLFDYIREQGKRRKLISGNKAVDTTQPQPRIRRVKDLEAAVAEPENFLAPLIQPNMTTLEAITEGVRFAIQMDSISYKERLEKNKKILASKAKSKPLDIVKEQQREIELLRARLQTITKEQTNG